MTFGLVAWFGGSLMGGHGQCAAGPGGSAASRTRSPTTRAGCCWMTRATSGRATGPGGPPPRAPGLPRIAPADSGAGPDPTAHRLNSPVARRPSGEPRAEASCRAEGPIASSSPPIAVIDGDGRRRLALLGSFQRPATAELPGPPGFTCPPRGVLAILGLSLRLGEQLFPYSPGALSPAASGPVIRMSFSWAAKAMPRNGAIPVSWPTATGP
jgi:hypothetical protein